MASGKEYRTMAGFVLELIFETITEGLTLLFRREKRCRSNRTFAKRRIDFGRTK
jgi:hypothetical protein